jgi:hypothetical protein
MSHDYGLKYSECPFFIWASRDTPTIYCESGRLTFEGTDAMRDFGKELCASYATCQACWRYVKLMKRYGAVEVGKDA